MRWISIQSICAITRVSLGFEMSKFAIRLFLLSLFASTAAHSATNWVEGQHYFAIKPAQPTNVAAGKVEVVEVFSYGCIACNMFYPTMDKLIAALPKNVQVNYVHASFNPAEAWPMFQRAYLTAQAMGIADKTHVAMFKAVWSSDELAVTDRQTNRLKTPMPTIEKAAAFYSRVAGVKKEEFLSIAKSFSIESKIKTSDLMVRNYRVDSTPTLIVNGKYRLTAQTTGSPEQMIELVKFLVAKETK
jgi:thiol:disulfide interchange protein DsbA